ncbi:hypothetical protein GXW71_28095 [Roseomonas hellenica]|uniref:NnrU domain-containing protein n=1 Tax=Plastoroseomonas hellenica TaxID=2687306 RepID=A0ABS5F6R8_9PROT|nr:NnrU family protein [Plastoroseomonas hellenica]MBR0668248.1 hypothetical protein [Plastoroseomonas hellenica]
MLPLVLAALLWVLLHLGVAGTGLRGTIVARTGERGFQAGFSIASFAAIALLIWAWRAAPSAPLWVAPSWLRWLAVVVMLPAFMLFVGSLTVRNPTMTGGDGATARGMLRLTRHPMLWSFALWALMHAAVSGTISGLLFFGAFAVTALAGMPSIDAKLAKRDPAGFASVLEATSILPGGAIAAGRNRLMAGELMLPVVLGAVLWVALLLAHPWLFGVAPLPS